MPLDEISKEVVQLVDARLEGADECDAFAQSFDDRGGIVVPGGNGEARLEAGQEGGGAKERANAVVQRAPYLLGEIAVDHLARSG